MLLNLSLFCYRTAAARVLVFDCVQFERNALLVHPVLHEKKLDIDMKKASLDNIEKSVILPRFEVGMGIGLAPGLNYSQENNYIILDGQVDSSQWVANPSRIYDFLSWGPTFGMEFNVLQPLNIFRYRAGHSAARLNVMVAHASHYKEKMKVSLEAQEIYFGYLYAAKMLKETSRARKDFDEAQEKIEELLDEESESVSQKDLLKLRSYRFELAKGYNEATAGLRRAKLGARFILMLPDTLDFEPADSLLRPVSWDLPPLDTLKHLLLRHNPDLKSLENGLEARRELLKFAKGEVGPDIFLLASMTYTKTWSPDRVSGGKDVFTRDPLNTFEGAGGLGVRWRLNFWSRYQKYKKERLEFKKLKRKEVYAARGLLLQLEEAYIQFQEARSNKKAAAVSLRAAEAWLKGAAMDYDLDPNLANEMISPYKTTLTARRNFFESVYLYNMACAKVLFAVGWTLSDFLAVMTQHAEIH